ncbi:MAG TPA: ATP-dependent Clp protease adaptor ClpS [Bacteroidia bacterium]|nr:ATP-dependent Clp protease adaptor ClpS [Bacteroidia bacterium]
METWNYNKEEHHIDTESELLLEPEDNAVGDHQIILYNDDVNTFDFVITALIKVCKHDPIQAEQCTYLVHYKGKCSVKKGTYEDLEPMCTALLERELTAEII